MPSNNLKYFLNLLFAFSFFNTMIHTQVIKLGSCPFPTVMSGFDPNQFSGLWYNNRNYYSVAQADMDCVTTEYNNTGKVLTIKIQGKKSGSTKTFIGKGLQIADGTLTVNFFENAWLSGAENYLILNTDYTSYAVIYSCWPFGLGTTSLAWLLTRDQIPSNGIIDTALAVFTANNIDQTKLKIVNQENC